MLLFVFLLFSVVYHHGGSTPFFSFAFCRVFNCQYSRYRISRAPNTHNFDLHAVRQHQNRMRRRQIYCLLLFTPPHPAKILSIYIDIRMHVIITKYIWMKCIEIFAYKRRNEAELLVKTLMWQREIEILCLFVFLINKYQIICFCLLRTTLNRNIL